MSRSKRIVVRRPRKTVETTLGGAPWIVVFRRDIDGRAGHWGQTYWETREIHIDPRVFNPAYVSQFKGRQVTPREIAIHEALHAQMPWLAEEVVDRMAAELDAYLDDLDL